MPTGKTNTQTIKSIRKSIKNRHEQQSEILTTLRLCKRYIKKFGGRKLMNTIKVLQFTRDIQTIKSLRKNTKYNKPEGEQ